MTSERPNCRPCHPGLALRQMARADGQFDRRLLNAFVSAVGVYPVGSLVRLASRRLGVVVAPGERALAPKVKVLMSQVTGRRVAPHIIDLAAPERPDGIVAVEDPRHWGLVDLDQCWLPHEPRADVAHGQSH